MEEVRDRSGKHAAISKAICKILVELVTKNKISSCC